VRKIVWLGLTVVLFSNINAQAARHHLQASELTITGGSPEDRAKVQEAQRIALEMVTEASRMLDAGWEGLSPEERDVFRTIFDPGQSGGIDGDFVESALQNFRRIQDRLGGDLKLVFVRASSYCEGMTPYYTNFFTIFVCPEFSSEADLDRLARNLVHEVGHVALLAQDRAYFSRTDSRYLALTPRGSAPAGLPLFSHVLRELSRDDTLYHPDAYAHFAYQVTQLDASGAGPEKQTPDPALINAVTQAADEMLLSKLFPVGAVPAR